MRSLWSDEDPTIRVRSRSICALIAKHILHKDRLRESELTWLQNVLGESSNAIYNSLENPSVVDNMNIDSFVYAVLSHDLPAVQTTSFVDTLAILMGVGEKTDTRIGSFRMGFSRLLQRAETDDHLREVADKLRRIYEAMFPSAAPEPLTSLSIGLQPLSWTDFPIPWRSTPTYHI
ncbi:hypothetical protein H4582DRAFT_1135686 [Lactarius indigo]|nr:hypothetical protein H4582DRAFT_1135686 [Lactarius indigo]